MSEKPSLRKRHSPPLLSSSSLWRIRPLADYACFIKKGQTLGLTFFDWG